MADAAEKQKTMTVGKHTYALQNKLGYGAFSWAVLAEAIDTSRVVALKFTKHSQGSDRAKKRQMQEIQTELNIFQKVRHKNVVALYGYSPNVKYEHENGSVSICHCMALECCNGGELFDIVYYTGKLDEKLARTIFSQIVSGVAAMHKHGLCHRDIKPQNILLTSQFQVKLVDFGSSKLFNRQELMRTFRVGTKGYQAPEVLLQRGYTLKCDIFSLGVLLFVILTKHPPFRQAVSEDQWFRQIAKKQFASFWAKHPKDKLTRPCMDLICKMLCYQPLDRLTIQAVEVHPWNQADVYSPSQIMKVMEERKKKATKGRANDAARCPLNFKSETTRAENKAELSVLPDHLIFRAVECKDHPWEVLEWLSEQLKENVDCKVFPDEYRLSVRTTSTYTLGFKKDGKDEEEKITEKLGIDIRGYTSSKKDSYYLDIKVLNDYSEASQQLYNLVLQKLGMEMKKFSDESINWEDFAGEMTPEEKKMMDDRQKEMDKIKEQMDAEELQKVANDVIAKSEKKKKKKSTRA